jgi:protein-tyrosine kinase
MGRIDDALRRASVGNGALTPRPTESAPGSAEAFVSPWTFDGAETEAAARPQFEADAAAPRPALPGAAEAPPLSVFNGFSSDIAPKIVTSPGGSPVMAEQFRRLAATLHHAQLVQGTKLILITSANPGDGKTMTATNLALTLSESYRRDVLLIDADLRRPSLHEVFRVPNVSGLTDGLTAAKESRLPVLQITSTLTLLTAGRPDPDPMSALTSPRMEQILREASGRFDWVIVDTAPIGLLVDARLLTTTVDGAIFVIRAGVTPYRDAMKALDSLGRDRVLGIVLNAVQGVDESAKYYDYGYGGSTNTSIARQG